jgi:hypothetical protein
MSSMVTSAFVVSSAVRTHTVLAAEMMKMNAQAAASIAQVLDAAGCVRARHCGDLDISV